MQQRRQRQKPVKKKKMRIRTYVGALRVKVAFGRDPIVGRRGAEDEGTRENKNKSRIKRRESIRDVNFVCLH
ncbi:hypothetical protein GWI33_012420 [Rhynchophorus ferrugineus]|uniref:Uncharacterized protein n=1 Tax=Rhynchophorus ferrugineus TaxID=354439 RepID=A0A834M8T1_RHYFE|nr:hypothetical protein GWI33_012420 [Rhynchophorus ferrugineus]